MLFGLREPVISSFLHVLEVKITWHIALDTFPILADLNETTICNLLLDYGKQVVNKDWLTFLTGLPNFLNFNSIINRDQVCNYTLKISSLLVQT